MNIENIQIGDTIKNYKVLCELLGQEVKDGKSKKYQLEDFSRYFDWEKSGQKFIITDIYDTPLTKEDKRKLGNNLGHYKIGNDTYYVDKKLNTRCGVYKIQLNNDIYIGSTIRSFRQRYSQHYQNRDNLMPHTQKMLHSGGKFKIVWVAPINSTENEIRSREQYYINQYKMNNKYNVINLKDVDIPQNRKVKKKRITIKEDNYEFATKILEEHKINIF